jgi:hypothetical protein
VEGYGMRTFGFGEEQFMKSSENVNTCTDLNGGLKFLKQINTYYFSRNADIFICLFGALVAVVYFFYIWYLNSHKCTTDKTIC